jgi:hypothetical protein
MLINTKRLLTILCLLYYSQTGCSLASNIAILSHNIAILIGRLFWAICKRHKQIGRGLLAKIISLCLAPILYIRKYLVYLKGIIGTLLPKKVPKQKNIPIAKKMGDQWLSSIKLYYSKKWEILYSITIKITCIIGKRTKKRI